MVRTLIAAGLAAGAVLVGMSTYETVATPAPTTSTTIEGATVTAKTSHSSRRGVRTDTRTRTRNYSGGSGRF